MGCDCIQQINTFMSESGSNTKLSVGINFRTGEAWPIIQTEKADPKKRGKAATVSPTYCPFCGVGLDISDATPAPDDASV